MKTAFCKLKPITLDYKKYNFFSNDTLLEGLSQVQSINNDDGLKKFSVAVKKLQIN